MYKGSIASGQLLWTAGKTAISPTGDSQKVNGNQALPALCTQGAPASNATYIDTSATYRIEQKTGDQTLIGFRDSLTFQFHGVRFAQEPER